MGKEKDLLLLIRSSTPLILIETSDEVRAIQLFRRVLAKALRPMYQWSVTSGLKRVDIDVADFGENANDQPELVLGHIASNAEASIYLLLDFHPYLTEPVNRRKLREICLRHAGVEHVVVLISPKLKLDAELTALAARLEMSLPDDKALDLMVRDEAFRWSRHNDGQRVKVNRKSMQLLVKNLIGLTYQDAQRLARNAIYNDGAISDCDVQRVMEEKFKLLNRGGVLQYEYELVGFDEVAGLESLKKWVKQRKALFMGDRENPYGLESPKGMLLLGVQGCGKSMAAKAVASGFGVPLLRLDFGALYNKYHGETERNLRESLSSAEVMAPCVMWIDEIEKGISVAESDTGTSKRVLGTLLTWMAERESKVFLVATANDISALPPELIRKGRFDELFFVDLPDSMTRRKVFEIHLNRRNQRPDRFDLDCLAEQTDGFSGSEIEQVVVSGLYHAMAEETYLDTEMLIEAARGTRPLSVVMAEKVAKLRSWAASRTVPAG